MRLVSQVTKDETRLFVLQQARKGEPGYLKSQVKGRKNLVNRKPVQSKQLLSKQGQSGMKMLGNERERAPEKCGDMLDKYVLHGGDGNLAKTKHKAMALGKGQKRVAWLIDV